MFSRGEDREEIKKVILADAQKCSAIWADVLHLFRTVYPVMKSCDCGKTSPLVIHPFTLEERMYCPECSRKMEALEREKEREELYKTFLSRANEVLRLNGAPQMFRRAKIEDFSRNIQAYASQSKGLYLSGDRGTGKTHLAVALMREHLKNVRIIDSGGSFRIDVKSVPMFVSVPEMLLEIRQAYSDGKSSEKSIIDKYTDRSFLVMDDLGAEKTTEWSMQILYIIVDRRYREEKRTIITSNLTLDELAERLDDRVASRIAGMCILVSMAGPDRRISKAPSGV